MEDIDPKVKIGNFFQKIVIRYELLFLTLVVLLAGLAQINIKSGLILTLVLTSIGIVYFLAAFAIPPESELTALDLFLHKLLSFGSSVSIIGILFKLQNWPNGDMIVIVGLLTLGICLIVLLYQRIKQPEIEKFKKITFPRIIILMCICGGFLYFGMK